MTAKHSFILFFIFLACSPAKARPDQKRSPIAMAEIANQNNTGVSAVEVNDYAPGHYQGALLPSPPHADMNAQKAIVVSWQDYAHRFIFSHEASYCPVLELSSGAAMCNQFFEGNLGDADRWEEIYALGRKWLIQGEACTRPESLAHLR